MCNMLVSLFYLAFFATLTSAMYDEELSKDSAPEINGKVRKTFKPLQTSETLRFNQYTMGYIDFRCGGSQLPSYLMDIYRRRLSGMISIKLTTEGDQYMENNGITKKKLHGGHVEDVTIGNVSIPMSDAGHINGFTYKKTEVQYSEKDQQEHCYEALGIFQKILVQNSRVKQAIKKLNTPLSDLVIVGRDLFRGEYKGVNLGEYALVTYVRM